MPSVNCIEEDWSTSDSHQLFKNCGCKTVNVCKCWRGHLCIQQLACLCKAVVDFNEGGTGTVVPHAKCQEGTVYMRELGRVIYKASCYIEAELVAGGIDGGYRHPYDLLSRLHDQLQGLNV